MGTTMTQCHAASVTQPVSAVLQPFRVQRGSLSSSWQSELGQIQFQCLNWGAGVGERQLAVPGGETRKLILCWERVPSR